MSALIQGWKRLRLGSSSGLSGFGIQAAFIGAMLALHPACKGNIDPTGSETLRVPASNRDRTPRAPQKPSDASNQPSSAAPAVPDSEGTNPTREPTSQPELSTTGQPMPAPVAESPSSVTPQPGSPQPTKPTSMGDDVWSPLTVMKVVNPVDFGAVGNGTSDDLSALRATIEVLPEAGGIVFFPAGKTFKKTDLLIITKNHVKLWSINRAAEIFQSIAGQRRHQSILWRSSAGAGVFGLKFRSDAAARFDALEDNQISTDKATLVEVVGNEIQGAAADGVFLYGSKEHYIEGNYIHHTWADHIHHTNGATASWVWNNYIFNELPSKGDDGIACVTYGADSPRCGDMEWWNNTILHSEWGRGYSVIGGNNILIHDNWAMGVPGAGIIVASEPSYNTAASQGITIYNNYVQDCGTAGSHPGILISGMATTSGPLRDITLNNNVSIGAARGPYREEGAFENVKNTNLLTTATSLPTPAPTKTTIPIANTSIMRTRDVSHVPAEVRNGLYRIHVRRASSGVFEQRFEYIIQGPPEIVTTYVQVRQAADDYLSEQRTVGGVAYALLLTAAPISLPSTMSAVGFRELREQERSDKLRWLWNRIDSGNY